MDQISSRCWFWFYMVVLYMVVLNLQGDVSWCFYFLIGGETGTPSVSVSALPGRMPWLHPSRRVNPRRQRQRQQVSRWDRSDRLSLLCGQPARIFLLRCWDDWEYMRIPMPMQTFGTCPGYVCICIYIYTHYITWLYIYIIYIYMIEGNFWTTHTLGRFLWRANRGAGFVLMVLLLRKPFSMMNPWSLNAVWLGLNWHKAEQF